MNEERYRLYFRGNSIYCFNVTPWPHLAKDYSYESFQHTTPHFELRLNESIHTGKPAQWYPVEPNMDGINKLLNLIK